MLPYVAVIRDSFHAALTSRVLWIAFGAIWLVLIALAPIGYREDFTTTFRSQDFHNGTRLKAMLAQGLVDEQAKKTPAGLIAATMPDELARQLRRVGEGDEVRIRLRLLADGLNESLDDESWYDAEAWTSTLRFRELRELDQLGDDLTESQRRRRARLRIEAAFPGVFEARASRSIMLTYAGLDFPANFAVDKTQFFLLINQYVIPLIIEWLMGFVLVFLGILVTASIIPDMLQPGSLHLLLSKPVSRTMLLLSKFFGGCAFVFLCVLQLVVGLYLIAGLRLDLWNLRLLWCIPVSVFLFSVFYSVSTLAGLIWRSPILAIGVTTIFGTICMLVGILGGVFDGLVTGPEAIQRLTIVGDTMMGSTRGGGLVWFDPRENRWVEALESNVMSGDRAIAPIAIGVDLAAAAQVKGGRFNPFGSGALDLMVLSRRDGWTPEPSVRLPTATSAIFEAGDDVLALNTGGLALTPKSAILAAFGSDEGAVSTDKQTSRAEEPSGWLAKLTNMMGGATSGFTSILPDRVSMTPPRSVLVDPSGHWAIAMTHGRLIRLQRPSDARVPWTLVADRTLPGEPSSRGTIAISGNRLLIARNEEPIRIVDAETFEPVAEVELSQSLAPLAAVGLDESGRFVLMTSDGRCREVRVSEKDNSTYQLADPLPFHQVESIAIEPEDGHLYVVHHIDRVDVIDASDFSSVKQFRPSLQRWRLIDRYVISPLRMLIPQTGELGETIESMVSGKSAVTVDDGSEQGQVVRYDILRPVLSCATFITVMLGLSCLFFATRDF
jgi:hypothetical protein